MGKVVIRANLVLRDYNDVQNNLFFSYKQRTCKFHFDFGCNISRSLCKWWLRRFNNLVKFKLFANCFSQSLPRLKIIRHFYINVSKNEQQQEV